MPTPTATSGATWRVVKPPYHVNVWGIRTPAKNREDGRQMVDQQVNNVLRHLEKVHGIPKEEVTEDVLPKGIPPFPGREYMSCSGLFHLVYVSSGVYKSRLCTHPYRLLCPIGLDWT